MPHVRRVDFQRSINLTIPKEGFRRVGAPCPIADCISRGSLYARLYARRDPVAGFMIRVPKVVLVAVIIMMYFGLLLVIPAVLSPSGFGQGGPQSNSRQNPDAKPKAHSVELKWKASPSVVVGYNVYRAGKSEGPYTKLNSSPVRETNYKDTTVQAGRTYFYRVTAVDAKGGESGFTSQIKAVVPSP